MSKAHEAAKAILYRYRQMQLPPTVGELENLVAMFGKPEPQAMSNERKPLLSDEEIDNMLEWTGDSAKVQMEDVRDFYEDLITKGELFTKAQVEAAITALTLSAVEAFEEVNQSRPRELSKWRQRLEQMQREQAEKRKP